MTQGIYLPADERLPLEVRQFNDVDDYQHAVGGLIDAVDLYGISATLYVNDEGLIIGLPINGRATHLLWLYVPRAPKQAYLVGLAETTSIPDELLRALTHEGCSGSRFSWPTTRSGTRTRSARRQCGPRAA